MDLVEGRVEMLVQDRLLIVVVVVVIKGTAEDQVKDRAQAMEEMSKVVMDQAGHKEAAVWVEVARVVMVDRE